MFPMRILIAESEIRARVAELGAQLTADLRGSPRLVVVATLRGSICFAADVIRAVDLPIELDVIGIRSYKGDRPGPPERLTGPGSDLRGADVLLVEDIVDTGQTLAVLRAVLARSGAAKVRVCSLLVRAGASSAEDVDYAGFTIGDGFVVGYGLDYNQRFRNLPYIAVPDPEDLAGL